MATDREIIECFRPWFQVETWSTTHHLDNERFNKCCFEAFQRRRLEISAEEFREYLTEAIVKEHGISTGRVERDIEQFVEMAETIRDYLSVTGQFGNAS